VGVPAFICWPKRFDKDQVSTTPFSTLDLLPTCAEAMQTELPGDRPLDGISMLPYLTGEADQRLASIPYRFLDSERKMFGSPTCAWISGKWKFLTNLDGDASRDQLFNLDVDRKEETNCAGQYPVRCAAFRTEIKEWLRSCRNSHAGNDYDTPVDMITPFQEPGGWK
jgi:arylsulfatase A-like enzyme